MDLVVTSTGTVKMIYGEMIDLAVFGPVVIRRASHVEPDAQGRWWADLRPVEGPLLGPFTVRSAALDAEVHWLEVNWLAPGSGRYPLPGRSGFSDPADSQGR